MRIEQIKPNSSNPRKIDEVEYRKLVQSIKDKPRFMTAKPLVIDEDGVLLAGNQRYRACLELGWTDIPTIQMHGLTEQEKKEFIVRDNTHSGMWDFDMLANDDWNLSDLNEWGVEVDFLIPTIDEPKEIDNTKKGKVCPHCNLPL